HLTVDLVGRDRAMDQVSWWADAAPVQLVHELTHQLGLRDEYREADAPHRPHVPGSLLGDLDAAPEEASLVTAGLRDRHLALLGALIGDVAPAPEEVGRNWEEARSAAVPDTREAVWVDPVSLPRHTDDTASPGDTTLTDDTTPADGTTLAGVPARMPQDASQPPGESAAPTHVPFTSGNFEFTNLKHTNENYRDKAIRIIETLRGHDTIREYVGGRPVRITLHVRTTETPADVIDRGADGVDINLASYYFEKYDIGYVMGMLAHEIGLHPLASRDRNIPDEEAMFANFPLTVPGLEESSPPRTMSTEGAGQADHVMAAYPSSTRHRIYRDIVLEMGRVLAEDARNGEEGARTTDVTDLFDTYLMDLATIAVTNDRRKDAAWEPRNTAKVYNAYRTRLIAQLAQDSPLRNLVPPEKVWWKVTGGFLGLGASFTFTNKGDSIQTAAPEPAGGPAEARPRLRQADPDPSPHDPSLPARPHGARDGRPRFVVRSGFDARRFMHAGDPVTDLTVRVALRGTEDQSARVREQLSLGVEEFLNGRAYRLPSGDRLHVTVEFVDPAGSPHLTVDLVGRDVAMDQVSWWADADPVQLVHELTHQLGLRDEYRDADSPHRPHILGSLLGDLDAAPEDSSLVAAGLRDRHLALLGALIGEDVTPAPEETDLSFAEARSAAVPDTREAVWVDPVSLPRTADDTTVTEVPAHMPQGADVVPVPPGPVLRPFKLGNFEFTNLNQTDRYV
ncbi:hypothetical protein AB0N31_36440, partial [Streptomyces sp. NPDC051051]|uniref:hypothetical protein n=1 Tax=Streptomyces sp. NPDC051051 TaxID=3155666 RepID=UPI00342C68FB